MNEVMIVMEVLSSGKVLSHPTCPLTIGLTPQLKNSISASIMPESKNFASGVDWPNGRIHGDA